MKKIYILAVVILLTGCGSSSPRFGVSEAKNKTHHVVVKKKASKKRSASKKKPKKNTPHTDVRKEDEEPPEAMPMAEDVSAERLRQSAGSDTSRMTIDQQKMMETIAEWLEEPYAYGGDGEESGIDCSAFTREVFEQAADVSLPRSSGEQAQVGIGVSRNELKFGDLVFFRTRGRAISHVGIYIGDDLFAHAGSGSGVTISSLDSTYFKKRYAAARRVLK
ncbi:MAG: C40 family peptidase [Acidobacteriota bacterium]